MERYWPVEVVKKALEYYKDLLPSEKFAKMKDTVRVSTYKESEGKIFIYKDDSSDSDKANFGPSLSYMLERKCSEIYKDIHTGKRISLI